MFVGETSILNSALIFFFFFFLNLCKVSARRHTTFVCKTFAAAAAVAAAANSMSSQTAPFRCLSSHDERLQFTEGGGDGRVGGGVLTAASTVSQGDDRH